MDLKTYWIVMLRDHKLRQQLFLANDPPEIVKNIPIIFKDNPTASEIISDSISYFTKEQNTLVYPAKAYAVAIIYAKLLETYFGIPFFVSLNDEELFFGTMKGFIPYQEHKNIYDDILKQISIDEIENSTFDQVQASIESFHLEFSTSTQSLSELRF